MTLRLPLAALALSMATLVSVADAQRELPVPSNASPIDYIVRIPEPHTHYAEIQATVPTDGQPVVVLRLATWTPGSYMIREYAQHIEGVLVTAGGDVQLDATKVAKNRWSVETDGAARITVRYRVYARSMSVRTNWIDEQICFLNGAPTFITLADSPPRAHRIRLELPPFWSESASGLAPDPDRGPHCYVASTYDELVDCPIVSGQITRRSFEVGGKPHEIVHVGDASLWDVERTAEDLAKIVREQQSLWGNVPYERYLFLNVIGERGGGLEHRNSTLMLASRWTMTDPERYRRWLGLVSHEMFHTWNVKRLRPRALTEFDYENESYTRALWIVEGVTSYYDDLTLVRAGLLTKKQYLKRLSKQIKGVETTPGSGVQSLADSSFDAWIKYYRRNENSKNTQISYYTKGAVVAFLLDQEIRARTNDAKSLDDVLRLAYERYSGPTGYSPMEFEACASEIAGADLSSWFDRAVRSTDPLDYDRALAHVGLSFAEESDEDDDSDLEGPGREGAGLEGAGPAPASGDAGEAADASDGNEGDGAEGNNREDNEKPVPGWLGLGTANQSGRLVVTSVERNTPGYAAGFNVDDEIIAIGRYRVTQSSWASRLKAFPPGTTASLVIARRGELREIEVTFGEKPKDEWKLKATKEREAVRAKWLGERED